MIVMKFGGSSVESAAAIERVAGIVKAREPRHPVVVVSAMGKTTNKLLAIAQTAIDGKREDYIRQLARPARFPFARSPPGGAAGRARRARPHPGRPFSGAHRTGERPGGAGRIDAALDRRHFQLRRAPFELHRHPGLPPLRHEGRASGFARRHRHRPAPHAGRAAVSPNLRPAGRSTCRPLAERERGGDGRLHRRHRGWRHYHAGPRRLRLHRVHRGRRHRRRRNPDLDRRGRHAHRRPDHPARRPSRQMHLFRRSGRAGLLRRQGAASRHRGSGHRKEHSGADPEFAPARSGRHAHRRRGGALRQRGEIHRLQAQDRAGQYSLHAHADGARIPAPHFRGVRPLRNARWIWWPPPR